MPLKTCARIIKVVENGPEPQNVPNDEDFLV